MECTLCLNVENFTFRRNTILGSLCGHLLYIGCPVPKMTKWQKLPIAKMTRSQKMTKWQKWPECIFDPNSIGLPVHRKNGPINILNIKMTRMTGIGTNKIWVKLNVTWTMCRVWVHYDNWRYNLLWGSRFLNSTRHRANVQFRHDFVVVWSNKFARKMQTKSLKGPKNAIWTFGDAWDYFWVSTKCIQ